MGILETMATGSNTVTSLFVSTPNITFEKRGLIEPFQFVLNDFWVVNCQWVGRMYTFIIYRNDQGI